MLSADSANRVVIAKSPTVLRGVYPESGEGPRAGFAISYGAVTHISMRRRLICLRRHCEESHDAVLAEALTLSLSKGKGSSCGAVTFVFIRGVPRASFGDSLRQAQGPNFMRDSQ